MYRNTILFVAVVVFLVFLARSLPSASAKKEASESPFVEDRVEGFHYRYTLFDPEMAPEDIKPLVTRGFHLMLETNKLLPEYVGNKLSCTNCHFAGGNTFGGKQNGLPLVGVTHHYPKKLKNGEELTLAKRIDGCFIRSMNGTPLPLDSKDMNSLVAYFNWISHGIPELPHYSWMGIKELRSNHTPDKNNGAKVYETHCAMCHGKDGQGQQRPEDLSYPPLWGENSFNDAAGMNQIQTFAFFVYENMPYDNPGLTVEEALDVAAFVTSQPRAKFSQDQ